jgi:hypothetical protein
MLNMVSLGSHSLFEMFQFLTCALDLSALRHTLFFSSGFLPSNPELIREQPVCKLARLSEELLLLIEHPSRAGQRTRLGDYFWKAARGYFW